MESGQLLSTFVQALKTDERNLANLEGLASSANCIEFRYYPMRIFKLKVEQTGRKYFAVAVTATAISLICLYFVQNSLYYPILIFALVATLLLGGVMAAFCSANYQRLAGRVSISSAGIEFSHNQCLCRWGDLIVAEPLTVASSEAGGVKLVYDTSSWHSTQRCAFGFQEVSKDRVEIDLDFRAVAEKDRPQVIDALSRFAPENRLSEQYKQKPALTGSFTQLWLNSLDAGPRREATFRLDPGSFLQDGRYEIVRTIASGGQATAYAAIDYLPDLNQGEPSGVVLKEFVLPIHAGERAVQEMLDDIERLDRLMKRIAAPHIVKLYRTFTEDFRTYLVFEHVPGSSLRELVLHGTQFSEAQVIALAKQMCKMLVHLHEQTPPVIHRDFAPDNLMLTPDGQLKVIDFDVAIHDEPARVSKVVGKPSFMAPEQFRGLPCCQSDIYSLGACLHFLLTGQDPTPICASHPKNIRSDITTALDAIVCACTQPSVSERIANARTLSVMLEEISK